MKLNFEKSKLSNNKGKLMKIDENLSHVIVNELYCDHVLFVNVGFLSFLKFVFYFIVLATLNK